jgi:acyl-CoA thioesterase-1
VRLRSAVSVQGAWRAENGSWQWLSFRQKKGVIPLMKFMLQVLRMFVALFGCGSALYAQGVSAQTKIKVACVGDSITQGVGAKNGDSYPSQLQRLLGDLYEVKNFGNSGSTMIRSGDRPYQMQAQYKGMLEMKADIYVVKLGTNDTKPHNWVKRAEFKPSAHSLIDAIREANPKAVVFVCLPVPVFPDNFGITDDVIKNGVIPQLKEVASEKKTHVIDLYAVLQGKPEMVPDRVHPNSEGYTLISGAVAKAIREIAKP